MRIPLLRAQSVGASTPSEGCRLSFRQPAVRVGRHHPSVAAVDAARAAVVRVRPVVGADALPHCSRRRDAYPSPGNSRAMLRWKTLRCGIGPGNVE
jgi:hypothetical protein